MEPTEIPTASPVPLGYTGPPDRPVDRIGPVLGGVTIAVAAVDAAGGLVGVVFGLVGRVYRYGGTPTRIMMAAAWVGSGLAVVAGVGLIRRRRRRWAVGGHAGVGCLCHAVTCAACSPCD